jgi:hypothetical protein
MKVKLRRAASRDSFRFNGPPVRRSFNKGGTSHGSESHSRSDRFLFVRCEIERKNGPGSGSCADSWYFASWLPA